MIMSGGVAARPRVLPIVCRRYRSGDRCAFTLIELLVVVIVIGVLAGIVVGAMPGLSATMAISVLVPFTFGLEPLVALGLMAGIYNGAMYGGAIPAILLRIPGTPAAVATTFDGYPMAQKGEGGFALQVACVFRGNPATDSKTIRPPIPILSGH